MRLIESEIQAMIASIEAIFKKKNMPLSSVSLFLFGSRVQDDLKGGDIDLLLRVPKEILGSVKKLKLDFLIEMKERLGQQKIDLLMIDLNPPQDPFHHIAIGQAVLLKSWFK